MKIWLRLVYADGDAAATLLRSRRWSYAFIALLYHFCIKSEVQLIYFQLNVNDRRTSAGYYEPQTYYIYVGLLEVQKIQSRRAKRSWVRPWFSADRWLHFGNYDQLIRALRMEDSSSFFNYTRMEPPRVVLESKRATPTSGRHLNQAWSWPGRQERSRSANVDDT